MPVPFTFDAHLDREIDRKVATVIGAAKSLHEELGYLILRFEREGADAAGMIGSGLPGRASEMFANIYALHTMRELRKEKAAFEQVAAEAAAKAAAESGTRAGATP